MATPDDVEAMLTASLEDHRLSRSERQALAARLEELARDVDLPALRRKVFNVAKAALGDDPSPASRDVFEWLEAVLKVLENLGNDTSSARRADLAEAHFSPGDACRTRIAQLLDAARRSVEICVFTITDDRISGPIVEAHRRGVAVRVISDDDKSADEGSDVARFRTEGIPVRVDRSEFHMHHKFALFDREVLLTGSYNWTRGAAQYNDENLVVTTEPRLITPFRDAFERIWERLE